MPSYKGNSMQSGGKQMDQIPDKDLNPLIKKLYEFYKTDESTFNQRKLVFDCIERRMDVTVELVHTLISDLLHSIPIQIESVHTTPDKIVISFANTTRLAAAITTASNWTSQLQKKCDCKSLKLQLNTLPCTLCTVTSQRKSIRS